ncbi:conserved hypothetical protein [Gammaproteobacteria bacterium]
MHFGNSFIMSIKKIIKYLPIGIILLTFGKMLFEEFFDTRPFRFEKYKTEEELEAVAKLRFPVGTDMAYAKKILEESGAECRKYNPPYAGYCCEYNTYILTFHPFECYKVWLDIDSGNKLIEVGAQKFSGVSMYVP